MLHDKLRPGHLRHMHAQFPQPLKTDNLPCTKTPQSYAALYFVFKRLESFSANHMSHLLAQVTLRKKSGPEQINSRPTHSQSADHKHLPSMNHYLHMCANRKNVLRSRGLVSCRISIPDSDSSPCYEALVPHDREVHFERHQRDTSRLQLSNPELEQPSVKPTSDANSENLRKSCQEGTCKRSQPQEYCSRRGPLCMRV